MLAIIVHGRIQAPSTLVTIQEHDLDAGVRRNLYKESSRQESPRPQAFAAIGTEVVRSILGGHGYIIRRCPPRNILAPAKHNRTVLEFCKLRCNKAHGDDRPDHWHRRASQGKETSVQTGPLIHNLSCRSPILLLHLPALRMFIGQTTCSSGHPMFHCLSRF